MRRKAKDDFNINYLPDSQKLLSIEELEEAVLVDTEDLISQDSDILSLVDEIEDSLLSQQDERYDKSESYILDTIAQFGQLWNAITQNNVVDFFLSPTGATITTLLFSLSLAYYNNSSAMDVVYKMLLSVAVAGGTMAYDTVKVNRLNHIKAENKALGQIITMQQVIDQSLSNARYINKLGINRSLIKTMQSQRDKLFTNFKKVKANDNVVANSGESGWKFLAYESLPFFGRFYLSFPAILTFSSVFPVGYNIFAGVMIGLNVNKTVKDLKKIAKHYQDNSYLGIGKGLEFTFGQSLDELKKYQVQTEAFAYAIRMTEKEIERMTRNNKNNLTFQSEVNSFFNAHCLYYQKAVEAFQSMSKKVFDNPSINRHAISEIIAKYENLPEKNDISLAVDTIMEVRKENTAHVGNLAMRNIIALNKEYKELKYEKSILTQSERKENKIDDKIIEIEKKIRVLCEVYKDERDYLRYAEYIKNSDNTKSVRSGVGNIIKRKYMMEFIDTHSDISPYSFSQLMLQTMGNAYSRINTLYMKNMMINEKHEIKLYEDSKTGRNINIKQHGINKKKMKYLDNILRNRESEKEKRSVNWRERSTKTNNNGKTI